VKRSTRAVTPLSAAAATTIAVAGVSLQARRHREVRTRQEERRRT
jgi:hypothetical protein